MLLSKAQTHSFLQQLVQCSQTFRGRGWGSTVSKCRPCSKTTPGFRGSRNASVRWLAIVSCGLKQFSAVNNKTEVEDASCTFPEWVFFVQRPTASNRNKKPMTSFISAMKNLRFSSAKIVSVILCKLDGELLKPHGSGDSPHLLPLCSLNWNFWFPLMLVAGGRAHWGHPK